MPRVGSQDAGLQSACRLSATFRAKPWRCRDFDCSRPLLQFPAQSYLGCLASRGLNGRIKNAFVHAWVDQFLEIPMQKSFNKLGLAGIAAAFALTPAMTIAQDEAGTDMASEPTQEYPATQEPAAPTAQQPATPTVSTPEQDAMMQSWPADQQAAFKTWPAETQSYFWSLNSDRQNMFWALSDADKVTLSNMPEQQRESTWAQIESRMTPSQS
jgi:hypothetical protein